MKDGKIAVGIVGCGGMGGGHAIALGTGTGNAVWNAKDKVSTMGSIDENTTDLSKKIILAGVYDVKPERQEWAREQGFFTYDSYEAMLADPDIDVILVATPNHLHKPESIAAMRAGKHVLCEKPVMMNSAELVEVMEVAKETGKIFYPRQNRRWDKDFLVIKKIYEEKLLGEVYNIESRVHGSRGIPGDWRGIKEYGGGMMFDWGVHLLDRLTMMIPEKIKKVYCTLTHITNDEVDDGLTVRLTFESGLTATVEVGTCNFMNLPLWYMTGNKGTASIEKWGAEGKMVVLQSWEDKDATPILAGEGLTKTMAPRQGKSIEEFPCPDVVYDRNELYSNLCDTINGTAEQIVTPEQALRVMRLMEAAIESFEKGVVIDFE